MEYDEKGKSIIIDNGTGNIKAAISGEEYSNIIIPSCIGRPKSSDFFYKEKKDYVFGNDIEWMKKDHIVKYPINRGIIQDWDSMEKIWEHVLYQLHSYPEECNVMLTQPIMNPKDQAEKMIQVMFETFNVQGFYITNPPFLSFYSLGKLTGLAVDSGESLTQYLAVLEGFELPWKRDLIEFGGKDLTEYLVRLLNEIHYIPIDKEKHIAEVAKIKACYVALDYQSELKYVEPFEYTLPDGTDIFIRDQRIKCCEALFNPSLTGVDYDENIAEYCNKCIKSCNSDQRNDLYSNIILSGGNTMFEGFAERFAEEIKKLAGYKYEEVVNVTTHQEKNLAALKGGCVLSSLSEFEEKWITKTEYEESGSYIVHKIK